MNELIERSGRVLLIRRAYSVSLCQVHKYGSPDVLQFKEVEEPTPKDVEVLVEVHVASVNYGNLILVRGKPFLARLWSGLLKPKHKIPEGDIVGRIEAVGRNVKQFQPGDEVFGDLSGCGCGAFAEHVCVPENALVLCHPLAIIDKLYL